MAKKYKVSSLISFQQRFGTEQACIEHLAALRWPDGYRCKKCGCEKAYQLKVHPRVFMCSKCNFQESVTAGAILHRTKLPLVKWFWAAYLLAQDKRGVSAMHISRELNLRYATAWAMLHKLRLALADQDAFPLQGVVEVDETYYGGKGGPGSGGRSLANENKTLIVMAVERHLARGNKAPGIKKTGFVAGNAHVAMIPSASSQNLKSFLKASLAPQTNMITDGWAGYSGSGESFQHEPAVQGNPNNAGEFLPLVHLQFNNLKSWLNGTFHGVSPKYLPAYLHEWNYRFNRRSLISNLFQYVIKRVANTASITYKEIRQGLDQMKPVHALCG
jgi:hypothetical protein